MSSKQHHTPGPWRTDDPYCVVVDKAQWLDGSVGQGAIAYVTHQSAQRNCQLWPSVPYEQARANARLIAQAPALKAQRDALLEAVEMAARWIGDIADLDGTADQTCDLITASIDSTLEALRDAIRQTKGGE